MVSELNPLAATVIFVPVMRSPALLGADSVVLAYSLQSCFPLITCLTLPV